MAAADPVRRPPSASAARWPLLSALVVAAVGFCLIFGLRLVSADDGYWSNPHGDMAQMLAGELAGLRAPWSLPILTPDTLIAPDRVSLVYTDSIPWLTALLKLTHLGRTFSLLGTFLLLSWLAQPAAMYGLLRAGGVRHATTLLAGCLLSLLVPAWLARQLGHIALSGQAFEIAALALAVRSARRGLDRRGVAGFAALGVAAVGVHAYHVPPVALMFGAALASDGLQHRPGALRRALTAGPGFVAALLGAAWVCGYFVGRGGSGGVAALGIYEMNLVAPVLPQGSALAGQKWADGWFTHVFDPTGGQTYEGYNYLGAGALLILLAAAVQLWRARGRAGETPSQASLTSARWGPLLAATVLLVLYSAGTKPYLGTIPLFTLPLPDQPWMEPFALFRCHGRFFWTVGYALLAGGLVVLDRSAGSRMRTAVLAAAVVLQAADMSQMLTGLHERFSRPDPFEAPTALLGPAFRGRDIRAYPAFFCTTSTSNHAVLTQLSVIAQRQGASINAAETARPPLGACTRPPPADARIDAAAGDRRLTVLTEDDAGVAPTTNLFATRRDCFAATGFWICGRGLAGVAGLTSVSGRELLKPTHPDLSLDVGTPAGASALLSGWARPEPTGVWSVAPRAVLRMSHPDLPPGAFLSVTLDALGYQPTGRKPQRALVSVGGQAVGALSLEGGGYRGLRVTVPSELLKPGRPLDLVLDLPDRLSPDSVTPGAGDARSLGMGLRRMSLAH